MRRARIRTTHDSSAQAAVVAAAVEPDNTESMATRTDGDAVVTTITRPSTGGLHASVDDYVVNVTVADRLSATATETADATESSETADATNSLEPTTTTNAAGDTQHASPDEHTTPNDNTTHE